MIPLTLALLVLAALLGGFVGAVLGAVVAGRRASDRIPLSEIVEPMDEYTAAAIDQAAVNYATAQGRPEVAPLLANKLHLLHDLARRRGR